MSLTLEARHLGHRFGSVVALDDVSFVVPAGTVAAIVGESGSGKTTALRCFNRLVTPDSGAVRIGDTGVASDAIDALRRRIGFVPQTGGLLPHWSVRRNVMLVPRLTGMEDGAAAACEALRLVGLPDETFGDRLPRDLSGGQRQRAALARALAARQEVVLLDEPFGALDAISRAEIHGVLERVRAARGFTALFVTHDLAEAARLADLVIVMRAGRVEQAAPFAALRDAPATPYVAALVSRARDGARAMEPA